MESDYSDYLKGGCQSGQLERSVKPLASAYIGSNPIPPTKYLPGWWNADTHGLGPCAERLESSTLSLGTEL